MLFYAARLVWHPAMKNPPLVVLTDRSDLDDRTFGQFQRCQEALLRSDAPTVLEKLNLAIFGLAHAARFAEIASEPR